MSEVHCQPLEARRLLAVMLDPGFGDGGVTRFDLPYPVGESLWKSNLHVLALDRLGEGYFASAWHWRDDNSALASSTEHFLFDADGNPTGFGGDGYRSLPHDLLPTRNYIDSMRLPDGSLLVSNAYSDEHPERFLARLLPDGTEDPDFSVEIPSSKYPSGFSVAGEGADRVGVVYGSRLPQGQFSAASLHFQRFDLDSGALIGTPQLVFDGSGIEWIQDDYFILADRDLRAFLVHGGSDGAFYASAGVGGAGIVERNLVVRYLPDESGFTADPEFGAIHLEGQTQPGALIENTIFGEDQGPSVRRTGRVLGLTPEGRIWYSIGDNDPAVLNSDTAFVVTLLNADGTFDTSIGDNGFIHLQTDPASSWQADSASEFLLNPFRSYDEKNFTVTADGSLVGIIPLEEAGTFGIGNNFTDDGLGLAVFRLTPDGEWDTSISGGELGAGRAFVSLPIEHIGAGPHRDGFLVELDNNRLVLGGVVADYTGEGAYEAVFARILIDAPTTQIDVLPDGQRVLAITGTAADDELSLDLEDGLLVLRANGSAVDTFDPAEVDGIEMLGGEGDDDLRNTVAGDFAGRVTLVGGAGNDTLTGNGRYDRLYGGGGNDRLVAGNTDTLLYGGDGNDTLIGSPGRDALWGGPGNDSLAGGPGADLLDGGDGDDTLASGDGNDTLMGSDGVNSFDGGAGTDLLGWFGITREGSADLSAGTFAWADTPIGSSVAAVEDLLGGDGDDVLRGDDGRNYLLGGAGNDSIRGGGGKDTVEGGSGADTLDGGDDTDLLIDLEPGEASPNLIRGGGGRDLALIDADDETEFTERVFHELDDLLAAL